jgi:hypothetical protein
MSQPVIKTPAALGLNTCKLCGETFTSPRHLEVLPANPTANSRGAQAAVELMKHIDARHLREAKGIAAQAAQFSGMLYLACFTLHDQGTAQQADYIRWYVHQMTLIAQVKNATIEKKSLELANAIVGLTEANHFQGDEAPEHVNNGREILEKTVADLIAATVTMLRDALQEPAKYPGGPEVIARRLVDSPI